MVRVRLRPAKSERQRGDVPGWVMITVMSAVLVVAILGVAKGSLTGLFDSSVKTVSTQNSDGH